METELRDLQRRGHLGTHERQRAVLIGADELADQLRDLYERRDLDTLPERYRWRDD